MGVLIVNLERFQKSRSGRTTSKNCKNIEPSVILTIDGTVYSLNAVITHYGRHAQEGHYVSTLHRNGHWIDCNDEAVKLTNDVPKMGYLFFYDRVDNAPLALPSVSISQSQLSKNNEFVAKSTIKDSSNCK